MLSEYLLYTLKYLRLVCSARKIVIPIVFFCCLGGWLLVWYLPNVYQSETRVYVDQRTMLDALLDDIVIDDRDIERDTVDIARVSLLTQSNLEFVAQENGMLDDLESDVERELMLEYLEEKIRIDARRGAGGQGTQDLVISYRSKDADHSKNVVQSFLDLFVTTVQTDSESESSSTLVFLDERIGEYKDQLEESEQELKEFRRENITFIPAGDGSGFFEELSKISERANEAKLDLREATNRRDQLTAKYRDLTSGSNSESSSNIRKAEQIQELELQLDGLLLQYTDSHPDVVATREQLTLLKRNYTPPTLDTESFSTQFALAEFQLKLGQADADVASAQARLDEYTDREAKLTQQVSTIPEIEAELQKLTRDYDQNKDRYDELVRSRQTAVISQAKNIEDKEGKFHVVEPPRTLPLPVEPNRPLLLSLIFFGAWALGIGLPILLDFVRPAVSSLNDISKITEFPVLGTVSMTENSAASTRMGTKTLIAFLVLTLIAYAVLTAVTILSITV